MLRRLLPHGALLMLALLVAGCGLNAQQFPTVVVTIPPEPTNTLAPLFTMTPRYTATPIPTSTLIPTATWPATETPLPAPSTATPSPQPTQAVRGSVNFSERRVNVRSGPGTDFDTLRSIAAGTPLFVLGISANREWYNIRVEEDGLEGWIAASFITVANPTAVAILSAQDMTQRAQQPAATSQPAGTAVPTLRARTPVRTDILAYCDLPAFRARYGNKSFSPGTALTIYWNWFAATTQQIQDHIDAGQYDVSIDAQENSEWKQVKKLDDWRLYRTSAIRQGNQLEVYWYVPIGELSAGEYRVNYKLTWTRKVEDGQKSFGPGGDEEINAGSCSFSVK